MEERAFDHIGRFPFSSKAFPRNLDFHNLTTIRVGSELPNAIVTLFRVDTDQACEDGETDEAEQGLSKISTIKHQKGSFESQIKRRRETNRR